VADEGTPPDMRSWPASFVLVSPVLMSRDELADLPPLRWQWKARRCTRSCRPCASPTMKTWPRWCRRRHPALPPGPLRVTDSAVGLCRPGSFEVKVNDVQVFSKLENGSFPDFQETVCCVEAATNGEKIEPVTKVQPSMCTIL